jgi:hypothetical protein
MHSNRLCRIVVTCQHSGLRIASARARDVDILCLVYLVMKSIQDCRQMETDIKEVQNWLSENYMDLTVLVIFSFLAELNNINCNYQIDVV